jgi:hypothetical protein
LDANWQSHGFLLDHGSYITLDVPGSDYTAALGINDSGQIVGYYIATTNPFPDTLTNGFLATPVP